MRTKIVISALFIAAATWGAAISHLRKALSPIVATNAVGPDNALDESRITERPIGYAVLSAASVQLGQALLSFSSEHGTLRARAIDRTLTIDDALKFNSLLNPRILGDALSARPVAGVGTVIWQRSLYNSPAVFQTVSTERDVSLYDGSGKRLWRLQSPPPDYTISVDPTGGARLTDRSGSVLWKGVVDKRIPGWSAFASTGHADLRYGTTHLTLDPGLIRLSIAGVEAWTGQTRGASTVIAYRAPHASSMFGIHVGTGESALLTWKPGIKARSTISIARGLVSVSEQGGRVSGSHPVDIGWMLTAIAPADYPGHVQTVDSGALVTPVAPLYIDGAVVHAQYSSLRGSPIASEDIRYQQSRNPRGVSAFVNRSITNTGTHGRGSTMSLTYPAPISPTSTTWAW